MAEKFDSHVTELVGALTLSAVTFDQAMDEDKIPDMEKIQMAKVLCNMIQSIAGVLVLAGYMDEGHLKETLGKVTSFNNQNKEQLDFAKRLVDQVTKVMGIDMGSAEKIKLATLISRGQLNHGND